MGLYLEIVRSVSPVSPPPMPPNDESRTVNPPGSFIRERITDKDGRALAVWWVSAHIGPMWVTLDRATALRCGLIRPGGPPVFYLDRDDVEFFRDATPEQLMRVAEFKRAFSSPEMQ